MWVSEAADTHATLPEALAWWRSVNFGALRFGRTLRDLGRHSVRARISVERTSKRVEEDGRIAAAAYIGRSEIRVTLEHVPHRVR